MSLIALLPMMLAATFVNALGSLLIKKASSRFKFGFDIRFLYSIIKNYQLLLGLSLYAVSGIIFIYALRIDEFSVVYPMASLTYIFVSLLSAFYLNEKITYNKWMGIGLIILGIVIIQM